MAVGLLLGQRPTRWYRQDRWDGKKSDAIEISPCISPANKHSRSWESTVSALRCGKEEVWAVKQLHIHLHLCACSAQ